MKLTNLVLILAIASIASGPAYAKTEKEKGLPPGLQKKVERGESLPPGWQKKLHKGYILESDIYARGRIVVPLGRDGTISIEIEGTILKLNQATREILDILHP